MPRDISGNYSLPSGNPVIAHETIESDWANSTMPDIAAALTDSLSRSGNGGMLVPFRFIDGSISAPGMTFANEPTSGIYRAGLNDVRVSIGTQDVFKFTLAGVTIPAGKTLSGSITAPSVVTPLLGTDTAVNLVLKSNGLPRWNIGAGAGTLFPSTDGVQDLGQAVARMATGFFATAVQTPLVKSQAGAHLNLGTTDLGTLWSIQTSNGDLLPTLDNALSFGGPGNRIKTGTFGTSVVTPDVVSPGALNLHANGGAVNWQIGVTGTMIFSAVNTFDLGVAGGGLRTGYFNTSVVTPSVNAAASALIFNAPAGFTINSRINGADATILSANGMTLATNLVMRLGSNVDNASMIGMSGVSKGIRIGVGAAGANIDGVDQTLSATYQPLALNGSTVSLGIAGVPSVFLPASGVVVIPNGIIDNGANATMFFRVNSLNRLQLTPQGSGSPLVILANGEYFSAFPTAGAGVQMGFAIQTNAGGLAALFRRAGGSNELVQIITADASIQTMDIGGSIAGGLLNGINFYTDATKRQVAIIHTANAVNALVLTGAAAGGNPSIGATGGASIQFNSPVTFAAGFAPAFESAELAITTATPFSVAHGLGRIPKLVQIILRCKVADFNYAIGEEMNAPLCEGATNAGKGISTFCDGVNVGYQVSTNGISGTARPLGIVAAVALTVASWRAVIRCW